MLPALLVLLASAAASLAIGWLLVRFERLHARISLDVATSGPQKFHAQPTPRIGGVPVMGGLLAGFAVAWSLGLVPGAWLAAFLLSVLPAYASGLVEDVTKRIGPDIRLWASFLSALAFVWLFESTVSRAGFAAADAVLSWYPLALIVTVVGIGGVAHAVNIIDGYNGLAAMVTLLMLAALGFVSWQVGDTALLVACAALAGGTLGFARWNFPWGRIFAGDGGAYLWGVSVAMICVMLVHRNPAVSPWFPLAVVIYPVFETLFTIYRRKFKHSSAAGLPDAKHLHQLVYRRVLNPAMRGRGARLQTLRNASTAPFLWSLAACAILPAALFWRQTPALIAITAGFCVVYVWLYRSIATFAVPIWLWRWAGRAGRWARRHDASETA